MQNFSQSFDILSIGSQNFIPQQNAFAGRRGVPLKEDLCQTDVIRINKGGKGCQAIEFSPFGNTVHRTTTPMESQNIINQTQTQNREPINTIVLTKAKKSHERKKVARNQLSQRVAKSSQSQKASKCTQVKCKYLPENIEQIGEEQCSVDEEEGEEVIKDCQVNIGNTNGTANEGFFVKLGLEAVFTNDIDQFLPTHPSSQTLIQKTIKVISVNDLEQNLVFEFPGEQGYYMLFFDSSKKSRLIAEKGKTILCVLSQNQLMTDNFMYNPQSAFVTYTLISIL